MEKEKEILKKYFGYNSFRNQQEEIIQTVLSGRDVLVLMPTGGGKSLCFQIPALSRDGMCIVISPLIALMKDQVESLCLNGVSAAALNSSLDPNSESTLLQRCESGEIKLLYISPEKAVTLTNRFYANLKVNLIAIDEAHCVSSWGHDFRPEYKRLSFLRELFPDTPVIALTASADRLTRSDILEHLGLKNPEVFISSFDRPNLSLTVKSGLRKHEKLDELLQFLQKHRNESGIIYCLSRKNTEELSAQLNELGIRSAFYHAGMQNADRTSAQEKFLQDEIRVMVATIAFGMGIDKSNVRWVVHYSLPKNMESYYQEIGRAGRDGLPSATLLLFSLQDVTTLAYFAAQSSQTELHMEKLSRMQQYAESRMCRRQVLLAYFGEQYPGKCGNCDSCTNPPKYEDQTKSALLVLKSVEHLSQKISTTLLVQVLKGSKSNEILERGFHLTAVYGSGKDSSTDFWHKTILQLISIGVFEIAYEEQNNLRITLYGRDVLAGKNKVWLSPVRETVKRKRELVYEDAPHLHNSDQLFEALRNLRTEFAKKEKVAPYIIFHDKTLREMVAQHPGTKDEFINVPGVSERKFEKYGDAFLRVLNSFSASSGEELFLQEPELEQMVDEMIQLEIPVTPSTLARMLSGGRSEFITEKIKEHELFGKLKGKLRYTDILPLIKPYFEIHSEKLEPYRYGKIQGFDSVLKTGLKPELEQEIREFISNQPPVRILNPDSDSYIINVRKEFPRAYEHWTEPELKLLGRVIVTCNDLKKLNPLFQRSESNMRSGIRKILNGSAGFN